MHPMVLLCDERQVVLCSVRFEIALILTHPMELVSDVGHVESRFSPFGDSVSVCAR
jgi:hypothetical protein